MNEINKLRNIFATFFNEEIKEDVKSSMVSGAAGSDLNKKVEMVVDKPV